MRLRSFFSIAFIAASISLAGCSNATTAKQNTAKAEAVMPSSITLFEAAHDGRINIFYDLETFQGFQAIGETSYRLTRIGAGPNGETVVFGVTGADKKKGANTPAAMVWDGKLSVDDFYGEMHKHNRIYVFDNKADMDHVRKLGHPSYMYTQIGAGPNGETLVFVLNSDNKKKKPVDLIAKYNSIHQ